MPILSDLCTISKLGQIANLLVVVLKDDYCTAVIVMVHIMSIKDYGSNIYLCKLYVNIFVNCCRKTDSLQTTYACVQNGNYLALLNTDAIVVRTSCAIRIYVVFVFIAMGDINGFLKTGSGMS